MMVDDAGTVAIRQAIRALRKRHLVEEGAHSHAVIALQNPYVSQGLEWKDKCEKLELENQQCYKAQSRLSEQLLVEMEGCESAKTLVHQKEEIILELQNELIQKKYREECTHMNEILDEKTNSLDLLITENEALRVQLEDMTLRAKKAEAEMKELIDRWMLEKMKDAEKLNEVNLMYEAMLEKLKVSSIEQIARQQVDGIVRREELGREDFVESTIPSKCKHTIHAHDGGCGSILIEHNSYKLVSGGQDRTVKIWDAMTGTLSRTLYGCLGSILDLTVTYDNKSVIAASSNNSLFMWDSQTGQLRHSLTGHQDKVCAVDANRISSRHIASASYDHTIKVWDLQKGYCINTIFSGSNCNTLCYCIDGLIICSGHVDGSLRMWDTRTAHLISEVAAHSQAITSVSLSSNGNTVLASGRDNLHNLFDMRSLEVQGTLRATGSRVATNWSRSCLSPDDSYAVAGSADGAVYVWSTSKLDIGTTLKGHSTPVLSCTWGGLGNPLVSADKNGTICIWE